MSSLQPCRSKTIVSDHDFRHADCASGSETGPQIGDGGDSKYFCYRSVGGGRSRLRRRGLGVGEAGLLEASARKPDETRLRVLIVDDNETDLLLLRLILERFGCDVVCLSDGEESIDMCLGGEFELVLMDCGMPGMDGLDATRRIRRREREGVRVPIVAVSAFALEQFYNRCLDAGMDEFIEKPVSVRELKKLVDDCYLRRGSDRAAEPLDESQGS